MAPLSLPRASRRYWSKLDDRLIRELSVTKTLRTPENFIVHSVGEVNAGLSQGRYFFMDVARDGIAAYEKTQLRTHISHCRRGFVEQAKDQVLREAR